MSASKLNIAKQQNATCTINGVLAADALRVWPIVERRIQPCLDQFDTGYEMPDLLNAIQQRDKQLWLINHGQAVGITSIAILPRWKKLIVEYIGGDGMHEWGDAWHELMQEYAKFHHCKYIEAPGRKGWVRIAQSRGDAVEVLSMSRKLV